MLFKWCKLLGVKRPRSKYVEQKQKQRTYDRKRRKPHKQGYKRKKALIYLLRKGLGQLQELLDAYPQIHEKISPYHYGYLRTIKKVLEQQEFLLTHPPNELQDRIVSLHKPYIRPIVRGKENKRVEFGMKVHMMQVDGICLFDKISFSAFNESTRLKISTLKHRSVFGALNQLGADRIYGTNENRRYLTEKQVFTCFPKKGPKTDSPEEQKLKAILATERATVLEGSFGTQKVSYGLRKIKAKSAKTEIVWTFFGVMTANAVAISKKQKANSPPDLKQAA